MPSSIPALQDQSATEGDNVTLSCPVSGMPPPVVSWMTPNGQRHSGYMLELTSINRSQAGEYKCEASNEGVIFLLTSVTIGFLCYRVLLC